MQRINPKRGERQAPLKRRLTTGVTAIALMVGVLIAPVGYDGAEARGAPESFADLVEAGSPAVVNISTVQNVPVRRGRRLQIPRGTPFGDFWDQFRDRFEDRDGGDDDEDMEEDEEQETREARSLGSGFIIDTDGYVVTNNHVIEDADEITVTMTDGTEFSASVAGRDSRLDLALLKVDTDQALPAAEWGDSDAGRVGDWVMAIGNPFGLGGSVTAGIISARNRLNVSGPFIDYIQTDAPINRGNSGGPLFDMDGRVIGVNTAIFSPSGGSVGIGFAIPSNLARSTIDQLREFGRVRRGWLGVGIQAVTEEIAESLGLDDAEGALVTSVADGGPAEQAGIEVGDVIVEWDGKDVDTSGSLSRMVGRTSINKEVDVAIWRRGERLTINLTTGELPQEILDQETRQRRGQTPRRQQPPEEGAQVEGMRLMELTDELRERYSIADDVNGVIVAGLSRRSSAFGVGIRTGAVIMRINQRAVSSVEEVETEIDTLLEEGRESALLLIHQRGNSAHVVLPLEDGSEDEE